MDSDTRKIAILAVLALGILIFILFYIFSGMSTREEVPDDQVGIFPIGPDRTDISPVDPIVDIATTTDTEDPVEGVPKEPVILVKETDWRDDVVDYTDSAPPAIDGYNKGSNVGVLDSSSGQDDFGLIEFSMDYRDYAPRRVSLGDRGSISREDMQDPLKYREAVMGDLFPSVEEEFSQSKQCGTVKVPADEQDFERFTDNLDNNKGAICMGEAIVSNCAPSLLVVEAQVVSRIYIGEREDGKCSFGVANNPEYLQLCSIESAVKGMTFAAWQQEYQDDPGAAFVALLNDFTQSGTGYDCKLHQYN